jgi:DNA-binding NarL/FixJ family response regulator
MMSHALSPRAGLSPPERRKAGPLAESERDSPLGLSILTSGAATDLQLARAVTDYLEPHPEFHVQPEPAPDSDVVLVLARTLTSALLEQMMVVVTDAENPAQCAVLVTGPIRERQVGRVIAAGVVSILPRSAITPRTIAQAVMDSSHGRSILSDQVTRWLVDEARAYHALMRTEFGVVAGGLTVREAEVLRLLAEGQDTGEIAERLHYSERTIKKIIQDLTTRLKLRNRAHAVSYALRVGAI